jgi:CheY-like chemotaxis protein
MTPPPAHILIAEDEPGIRANLDRLLRFEGFRVSLAQTGDEALALIHAGLPQLPDLLLSDLMMPGLDGHALLRGLRADPRTAALPVVLLTARADAGDVQAGLSAGATAYVAKPYHRTALLACIRSLLAPGTSGTSGTSSTSSTPGAPGAAGTHVAPES